MVIAAEAAPTKAFRTNGLSGFIALHHLVKPDWGRTNQFKLKAAETMTHCRLDGPNINPHRNCFHINRGMIFILSNFPSRAQGK